MTRRALTFAADLLKLPVIFAALTLVCMAGLALTPADALYVETGQ